MVRKQLRMGVRDLPKIFAQYLRDYTMQLTPLTFQHAFIGSVLQQCMLEAIIGVSGRTIDMNEVCVGQPFKVFYKCGIALPRDSTDELI